MQFFSVKSIALLIFCATFCLSCSDNDGGDEQEGDECPLYVYDGTEDDLPTYTGLPIVDIRTEDGLSLSDKETWREATLTFYGNGKYSDFTESVLIKGRGNSTFRYPKKPFNLKFTKKKEWLGMQKSKHWAFLANYLDQSLMSDDITFYLGRTLATNLEWTPSGEFVELMFNGHHVGNYYVVERIKVEGNRLNIQEIKEEDVDILTGGYLLEFDSWYDEINQFKSAINQWPVCIKSPDEEWCSAAHIDYITTYINTLERYMKKGRFDKVHEMIDMPSFVDYYIIQLFCGNRDFDKVRSIYGYKKRDGKFYAGPLWDFDFGAYHDTDGWYHQETLWYVYLFSDPLFVLMLKERWAVLGESLYKEALHRIQQRQEILALSANINYQIFPYREKTKGGTRYPNWETSVATMRNNILLRKKNLDKFINKLKTP